MYFYRFKPYVDVPARISGIIKGKYPEALPTLGDVKIEQ